MYESPITQILADIQTIYEADCLKMVQKCGFDVNKTELEKALSYDRSQYVKGYKDGYADAIDECIKIIEETTWRDTDMLVESIRELKGVQE